MPAEYWKGAGRGSRAAAASQSSFVYVIQRGLIRLIISESHFLQSHAFLPFRARPLIGLIEKADQLCFGGEREATGDS